MRTPPASLLPTILWAGLVAVALLAPGGMTDSDLDWVGWFGAHGGDKLVHLVLFFGQAFWLSRALGGEGRPGATRWRAPVLAALYGLILETAQLVVPGRGFELADLAANTVGAFMWPVVGRFFLRR